MIKVKHLGKIIAELSAEELNQWYEDGKLNPLFKLSFDDGQTWTSVFEMPEFSEDAGSPGLPPSIPKTEWHYNYKDSQNGPVTQSELQQAYDSGQVDDSTFVWNESLAEWEPITSHFQKQVGGGVVVGNAPGVQAPEVHAPPPKPKRPSVPKHLQKFSFLAIAGFFFSLLWVFGLASIAGIVLSIAGIGEIAKSGGYRKGYVFAVIGLLFGLIGTGIGIKLFVWPIFVN